VRPGTLYFVAGEPGWTGKIRNKALFTLSRYTARMRPDLDTRTTTVATPGQCELGLPYHAGLLRFHPVVLRWGDGYCRKSYGYAPDLPDV